MSYVYVVVRKDNNPVVFRREDAANAFMDKTPDSLYMCKASVR